MAYNKSMTTLTIPKELVRKGELVVIPRKEYEELLELKKIKEFTPTSTEKKVLAQAENNFRKGKTLSYNALLRKLGFTS